MNLRFERDLRTPCDSGAFAVIHGVKGTNVFNIPPWESFPRSIKKTKMRCPVLHLSPPGDLVSEEKPNPFGKESRQLTGVAPD